MNIKSFDQTAAYFPDVCFKSAPDLGIVLGSGWGAALEMDEIVFRAAYADIPGLGSSTIAGHAGEFILYRRHGKLVAAWCGRRHHYEGVSWEQVVTPVEMLRRMGGEALLLTNAAGGVNAKLKPGDFIVLKDHINLLHENPLVGPHVDEWGPRFPDMSEIYFKRFRELLKAGADRLGIHTMEGVYAFNYGPAYETPAEIRTYKMMGADAVGMSTVPEAIFARSCGMKIAGLSLVSNLAAGISPVPLDHREVMAAGEAAKPKMKALIEDFIDRL